MKLIFYKRERGLIFAGSFCVRAIALSFFTLMYFGSYSSLAAKPYRVKPNDTLWSIARVEMGNPLRWVEIAEANGISSPGDLESGSVIEIPGRGVAARAARDSEIKQDVTDLALTEAVEIIIPPNNGESLNVRPSQSPAPSWREAMLPITSDLTQDVLLPSPLSFNQALAIGLTRAPEVRAALTRVKIAEAEAGSARADALPSVTLTGDARRSETFKSTSNFFETDEATFGGAVTINQSLFSFGRIAAALKAASSNEAAALVELAAAMADIRFRIESAFLRLLLAKERVRVATEAHEVASELVRKASVRLDAGAGTRFDVMKASAEEASAKADVVRARYMVRSASEEVAAAMGLSPATSIQPEGELTSLPKPRDPAAAVEIAMRERPGLAILSHRIASAHSSAAYARAQGYPSIDAIASGNYTRHEYISKSIFIGTQGKDESSGYVGVGVTVPIFDGYRVRETTKAEEARAAVLEAQLQREKLDAEQEIRAVYYDLAASYEAMLAEREGVTAAREALRMAELSFREGFLASLDVIQAVQALTAARSAELERIFDYRMAIARLVRSCGSIEVIENPGSDDD